MLSRKVLPLALVLAFGIIDFPMRGQVGAGGSLVSASPPMYPLAAKAAGIEGKVQLEGIIGKDGVMKDLRVVKGPVELQQAALDAVRHWRYRPSTENGQAIEEKTTVTVNFAMGSKKEKAAAQAAAQAALAKAATDSSAKEAVQDPAPKKD